ncbi:Hypothetical protein R9X50_00252300 [Acrodontium crateriforme]|uniref:Uncharacterized protein n=1 Tax=Acrodontium crateriforme TaxID=150365 RepID=A0AAQ3M2L6_9PEZI|nr:Hypothetical protein R9X50_00252300 [Acrodontium crateriforme]
MAVIAPAMKVGAAFGAAGFLYGGTRGTLANTTPLVFATSSGIRGAMLGSTLWVVRSAILSTYKIEDRRLSHATQNSSAAAGAVAAGFTALLTRGRSSVLPQAVLWSLLGYAGQFSFNKLTAPRPEGHVNFWRRMADKKWSPFTYMTDEEYTEVLREKQLRLDADISILDDKIAALRNQILTESQAPDPGQDKK